MILGRNLDLMETCKQCGRQFEGELPIVAIIPYNEQDAAIAVADGIANGKRWLAVGFDGECHQKPKLKTHFFYRRQLDIAMKSAGSSNLG